ncbi:hypothetical protein PAERUG_P54_1_London_24_VIM_2_04_13_05314 [Pseudomonas aeruginosa]|nr:hypothetical protein PAERUG_P54_1_London_24_VIM_2_04_13_05314 [Pseudomonas aeruginosa]
MSLTIRIMSRAEPAAVRWYSASSTSIGTVCISSSEPITPLIGVRSSWVTVARNSSFRRLLLASSWFSASSLRLDSWRIRARSSFIALIRSASASDSKPTSSAEPIWLAYMVRNMFGR